MEVVGLKKTSEKSNACVKFRNNSIILDEILYCQRSPFDKSDLDYNSVKENLVVDIGYLASMRRAPHSSKMKAMLLLMYLHVTTKTLEDQEGIKNLVLLLKADLEGEKLQEGFKSPGMQVISMVLFSCTKFGHKALDFRSHASSVGPPNNTVCCWICNRVAHIVTNCNTMRCYNCYGFGQKSQDCASTRRQPMIRSPYTSTRRTYEPWKKNNAGRFEAQKTCVQSQRHSQVWVYKNILLNVIEVDQCTKYGCHMASQA